MNRLELLAQIREQVGERLEDGRVQGRMVYCIEDGARLGPEAAKHRPSLAAYNAEVLELMLGVSAAGALLSYSLYTIESARVPADGSMALTIPFVAFGLFRFLLLMSGPRQAEAPDRVLVTDPQVLLAVAGFTATALAVLVAHR